MLLHYLLRKLHRFRYLLQEFPLVIALFKTVGDVSTFDYGNLLGVKLLEQNVVFIGIACAFENVGDADGPVEPVSVEIEFEEILRNC